MRALALTTALAVTGCSFALVRPVRTQETEPAQWPRCTEHRFWQLVDGATTVLALSGLVYFLRSDGQWAPVGAIVEGGLALGFGISALTGYSKTSRCRDARAAYEAAAAAGR